jgi:hypothetical protein
MVKAWEKYEDAARAVIEQIKVDLGLDRVFPAKAKFQGKVTKWEIDVTAFAKGTDQLVVFECRHRGRNVEKAQMGAVAYTVHDLGAKGFVISKKELSKGAKEVARAEGIGHMQFLWDKDTGDSILRWLNKIYVSVSSDLDLKDRADAVVDRKKNP